MSVILFADGSDCLTAKVFEKETNTFARKYLIKGDPRSDSQSPILFELEFGKLKSRLASLLLRHDGLSMKVYGENIPLVILINVFGLRGLEALLEQDAIEFVLWSPLITFKVSDLPGINPLQSGNLNSPEHSDPEQSVTSGLRWLAKDLAGRDRRRLVKKVVRAYKIPPSHLVHEAATFGHEGYEANLFSPFGLPKNQDLADLNRRDREVLAGLAEQSLELAVLTSFKYDSLDSFDVAAIHRQEFSRLRSMKAIDDMMDNLFKIEKLPNFDEMISKGIIAVKDVPRIRSSGNSGKFRKWINEVSSHTDAEGIAKEYIDSVVNSKSKLDYGTGKLLRTATVLSLSAIASAVLPGAGGIATSSGLSLLDSYVVSALSHGWSPRHFFDREIRPLIERSNSNIR